MRKLLYLAACFTIAACSDDSSDSGSDTTPQPDVTDSDTSGEDTSGEDTSGEDTSTDSDSSSPDTSTGDTSGGDTGDTSADTSTPNPREFGSPCTSNLDCNSGYCVEGTEGYICTRSCSAQCDEGFDCKSVQDSLGDVLFLCMPRVLKLCTPCLEDFQCNGGACLQIDGSGQCASHCESDDECLDGYACRPDATGERGGNYCQPKSGSCECSPPYAGVARACTRTNALGTCIGVETCDPDVGWVGCSAREAAPETCDYVDNDCDNVIDEDFKNEGLYAEPTACGSCNTSCDDLLANTTETTCTVIDGAARCQVISCAPGYSQLNDYVCTPDAGNVCQPCTEDVECLGNGAACTQLTDGKFCTRACSADADCAAGFICSPEHGNQCIPESGSCTCDGSNTDLARSCEVTYTPPNSNDPAITCRGLEACTAEGWGGCALPAEECDGIDNDCNGIIDDTFKTGDAYTHINHCGACGNSCLAFARPNAAPVCETDGVVPTCGYECVGNAVDVNGRSDDGCECVPVDGPDLAGDSIDSNCDGVDGEVDNAIFVSREGTDTNPGTRDAPMLTVQGAIARASQENKRDVYVATGVYSESIELRDGVGVFGGYSPYFDTHDVFLYETALIGTAPTTQRPGTVNARDLGQSGATRDTVVDGFSIFGTNAANTIGESSYGVYIMNAGTKLRVSNNRIYANAGGNGQNGNAGVNGANGVDGAAGVNAYDINTNTCSSSHHRNGGAGGVRMCGTVNVSGGNGGTATCPIRSDTLPESRRGQAGKGTSPGVGGTFGYDMGWGNNANNAGCACYLPVGNNPYTPGSGASASTPNSGSSGSAAGASGSVVGGLWRGAQGGNGGSGSHGSGGGGGGAGGGVSIINSCGSGGSADLGGSGGGGGSGGCAGNGGTGGTAGGGSFGIFVFSATTATPVLNNNTISNGRGGTGGNGGAGGVGGVAGKGAIGGVSGDTYSGDAYDKTWCAAGGGVGGNGSDGGHGGGGGGGAGGVSYGIYAQVSGTPPGAWKTGNTFLGGGGGGNGGAGGVSMAANASGSTGANGASGNANF